MATNCAHPNSLAAPGGMTEGLDVGVRGAAAPHTLQHLSRALGLGVGVVGVAVAHDGVQVHNVVVDVLLRGGCALALPLGWAVVVAVVRRSPLFVAVAPTVVVGVVDAVLILVVVDRRDAASLLFFVWTSGKCNVDAIINSC